MSKTVYADVQGEYDKNKHLKPEDVRILKEWADKQPHLPELTELQILIFLQSCYYSNEAAKSAIDTFFTVRTMCPEIFSNRNPADPAVMQSLDVASFIPLEKKTPEGYQVIFMRLVDTNPDNYVFVNQLRNFDMSTMLELYQHGTSEGHLIVVDMEGIVFGHLTKLGIMPFKKFLYYLQEGMPLRLKGLHYFNTVSFMDKILAMMKPFMKKELLEVLHLHDTVDGLIKFVPRECLPNDYGGTGESLKVLHDKYKKTMLDNTEHFLEEDKQLVDESKRPGKPKNINDIFGVEGTFKKLDID